jgi:hypothetical protein
MLSVGIHCENLIVYSHLHCKTLSERNGYFTLTKITVESSIMFDIIWFLLDVDHLAWQTARIL